MASLKSKVFNFAMRNRHLLHGKLKKEVFTMNSSIPAFRERCEKGAAKYGKIPNNVRIIEDSIAGIKSEWLIPEAYNKSKLILYIHGGGYVSGSCSDHRGFVSRFAKNSGYVNLVYEYRLAPEHPFPGAIEDSLNVYKSILLMGYKSENIVFAGESAGGGLALALLLALKENNLPMPKAAVAISPWTDLTCSGESYKTKNKVSVAPLHSWKVFSKHYVNKNNPKNPLISPLYGNPEGLPPLFINSGMDDELFDDGKRFALKARKNGVDVTFRAGEGQVHCYPLLAPMFKEATEAMDKIVEFIKKHLN